MLPLRSVRGWVLGKTPAAAANVPYRLKRLRSIEDKLRRFSRMALSRMQDIGGCRVILRPTNAIRLLRDLRRRLHEDDRYVVLREHDYIAGPKADGYRGIHLVFRFRARSVAEKPWDGLRIETQLRTLHQHCWATAVETIDAIVNTRIKTGGPDNGAWDRFFTLMAGLIAHIEGQPAIPGTPASPETLWSEAEPLAEDLDVENWLRGLATVVWQGELPAEGGFVLLVLDGRAVEATLTPFPQHEEHRAMEAYLRTELEMDARQRVQVCLVPADSIRSLRETYPNLLLEALLFVELLQMLRGTGDYRGEPIGQKLSQLRSVFSASREA